MRGDCEAPHMASKRFGKARPSGEPSSSTERKIRILLELIRNRSVRLSRLCDDYATSERSMLRDFQELRKIGARAGFTLSDKVENDRLMLKSFEARPRLLDQSGRALHALMRYAAKALGEPVEKELAPGIQTEEAGEERRFLHFMMPTLREGTRVADVFKTLEEAWNNNARVRFRYAGKKAERRVEPYYVLQHSGRYYLLGRDISAKDAGWRYFALDQIETPIARVGTFTPGSIPEQYRRDDALGWIQGPKMQEVSVWLSPQLASSATSRLWQRAQHVAAHADGSATMTFTVSDPDEVVRWSLGFGAQARIVAPHSTVDRAREMAQAIAQAYK